MRRRTKKVVEAKLDEKRDGERRPRFLLTLECGHTERRAFTRWRVRLFKERGHKPANRVVCETCTPKEGEP